MPPDDSAPTPAQVWLARARSMLVKASAPLLPDVLPADHCYDAQQAAEKAIKAIYLMHGTRARDIHDIDVLLKELPAEVDPPDPVWEAATVTYWAVKGRYSEDLNEADENDVREAIELATNVYEWAAAIVNAS